MCFSSCTSHNRFIGANKLEVHKGKLYISYYNGVLSWNGFDWKVEIILVTISATLFIGAGEMAFPIRKLFNKFRNQ